MTVHVIQGTGYDSNCYLVSGERPVLVDTGTGVHHDCIERRVREIIEGGALDIILTHRHYDHVGGARRMADAFGASVMMHPLDAGAVRDGDARGTAADMFGRTMDAVATTDILEGHVVNTGDHVFTVLHTPGHSAGGICLYEERSGVLISGDTVFANGVGRWDLPTGDLQALAASIRRLAGLHVTDIYPGHGPEVRGGAGQCLRDALNHLGEHP